MKILCFQGSFNCKIESTAISQRPPPPKCTVTDGTFTITDKFCELVAQSCPTLCNSMDCSAPGSSVDGIPQARMLEWVAISSYRGSSQPRSWTRVSFTAVRFFTGWATRESLLCRHLIANGSPQFTAFGPLAVLCILWVSTVQSFKNKAQIRSHFAENLPQASHYTRNKDIPPSRPGPLCFWYFLGENTLFSALHMAGSFGSNVRSSQKFL